jgi:hypothetical protein
VFAIVLLTFVAAAQQTAPTPDETRRRLDELERRNADLERRLGSLEQSRDESDDRAAESGESGGGQGLTSRFGDSQLTLQLFGDYGFGYRDPPPLDQSHSNFEFGSLGMLVTGRIGDHFRILSETLVEADGDTVGLDQERLYGAYDFNDALYAKLGLEHLPTARWNRLYHHGKWLQLTIERPFLAHFEDDGGILPMHESGLELGGSRTSQLGMFEWVGVVSNGRGPVPSDRQRGRDDNDAKAVDVGLSLAPSALRGLTFGGNGRYDVFPTQVGNAARTLGEREFVGGAFVQFDRGPFTSLAEVTFIQHQDRTGGATYHHHAAYAQAGWRFGEVTPYVRADTRSMEHGDPFYASEDLDLSAWELTTGLRDDFASSAAAKLEVRYGRFEERDAGVVDARHRVTLALQLCWFF